jgi:hypothetical protein
MTIELKKENIVEYPRSEDEQHYKGHYDDSMFTVHPTVRLEGDILLITILKSKEMKIFTKVENDEVIINAYIMIENAFSSKDNTRGRQKIVGLINGDYKTLIINKTIKCDILVLIPNDIL